MYWATQCTNPHYGRSVYQGRRKLFSIGGRLKARAEGPRKFLNLESLKCHFLDFGEDLAEFQWSENSVLVCRNLQFSSTKWAKAYLINYIFDKLQESMGNIFILCSLHVHGLNDKGLHDFGKKRRLLANYWGATALYI